MQRKLLALAAVSLPLTLNAQTWTEVGEAGELASTAQIIAGLGALTQIDGSLAAAGDTDMYAIRVTDPALFTATTQGMTGGFTDSALWIFDCAGRGISFNDDTPPPSTNLLSTVTGQFLPGPGVYLLAVNAFSNDAENAANDEIWLDTPFAVERQPDGPAATRLLDHWDMSSGASGAYQVFLTGAEYIGVMDEAGDAGDSIATNQPALGCGPLTQINGDMTASGEADLYMIRIPDPTTFTATTDVLATAVADTQLWLFGCDGTGYSFNDDTPGGSTFLSTVTGNFLPPGPGVYVLAVTGFGNDALNDDSPPQAIWANTPFNVERAPDGPGAANPILASWTNTSGQAGTYEIHLTGAEFLGVGAPSCVPVGVGCGGASLSCDSLPISSSVFGFTVSGVPSPGAAVCLARFGLTSTPIPLSGPLPPGCFGYLGLGANLVLSPIGLGTGTASFALAIPPNPGFVGLPLSIQGVTLDTNAGQFATANALEALIGDC